MDRRYAVVAFTEEDQEDEKEAVAIIPTKWIEQPNDNITDMFWPPKNWPDKGSRSVNLKKAIKNCIEPDIHWPLFKGSVLHLYDEYGDALKGLKRAEDNTCIETDIDDAPRKRKPPRRYIDSGEDDRDEENNLPHKKRQVYKSKVRKLIESDDENEKTLPQVNPDILNALKENSVNIHNVQNKARKNSPIKQSIENIRVKVLREFQQSNSSQEREQQHKQLKKFHSDKSESNNTKYEKQRKIDYTRPKSQSKIKSNMNRKAIFVTSKTSSVLSSMKDKVPTDGTSEDPETFSFNSSMSTCDFVTDDIILPDTQMSSPSSMQTDNLNKESSCSKNPPLSLAHITTCDAYAYSSSNSGFDQHKTNSIVHKVDEKQAKPPMKPDYSTNSKNKDNCKCKDCNYEKKLSSTVLLEISAKLDSVLINQAIILRSVNPDHAKSIISSNIPPIPLKTKEDFQKMETFLGENRINYEAMRDLLNSKCASTSGASSVSSERSVTGNVLSKLISNNFARQISWSGAENKIKFSDTKLCELVFGAVKLRFPNSFLTDAEAKIKRWFQTANGRKIINVFDDSASDA